MNEVIEGGDLVFHSGGQKGIYMSGGMQINSMFLTEGISPLLRSGNLLIPAGLAIMGGKKNTNTQKTTIFDRDDTSNSGVVDSDLYNKLLGLCSTVTERKNKTRKRKAKIYKKKTLKKKIKRKKTR
tara:strand:- start:387 stop:764 length:378 start_codon:yes stop_codon:yes gene_type:complete